MGRFDTSSFDIDFCAKLEYAISQALAHTSDSDLKWIWCDGISPEFTAISEEPQGGLITIVTKGWLGESGQDVYCVTIHLGEGASRSLKSRNSLIEYIPSVASTEWLELDLHQKRLIVRLR